MHTIQVLTLGRGKIVGEEIGQGVEAPPPGNFWCWRNYNH